MCVVHAKGSRNHLGFRSIKEAGRQDGRPTNADPPRCKRHHQYTSPLHTDSPIPATSSPPDPDPATLDSPGSFIKTQRDRFTRHRSFRNPRYPLRFFRRVAIRVTGTLPDVQWPDDRTSSALVATLTTRMTDKRQRRIHQRTVLSRMQAVVPNTCYCTHTKHTTPSGRRFTGLV
jgi:hypothetical protein